MYLNGCKIGRAYIGACALDNVYRGECSVIGAGPALLLDAFTYDPSTFQVLNKEIGVGDVDTLRTAIINVPDFEGVCREIPSGQISYPGARRVENLIATAGRGTTDFTAWTASDGTRDGNVFTTTGTTNPFVMVSLVPPAWGSQDVVQYRIHMTVGGGARTLRVNFNTVPATGPHVLYVEHPGGTATYDVSCPLSELYTFPEADYTGTRLVIYSATSGDGTIGDTITLHYAQIELVTSQLDKNPSNFTSEIEQYANYNGNTVDGTTGFVTEGTGALLDSVPYALVAPAATNHIKGSKDVTRSPWLQGSVFYGDDYDGIDGSIGTVRELLDSDATYAANYQQIPAFPYDIANTRFYIRRNNSNNQRSYFRLRFYGTLNQDYAFYFRSDTGVITPGSGVGTTLVTMENISGVDWWKVSARQVDTSSNSGYWVQMYPADLAPESTGSLIVGQVDVFNGMTLEQAHDMPPIFTTSVAVSRDKDAITLDSANLLQAGGTISFEIDQPANTANSGVISAFLGRGSGIYRFTDDVSNVDSGVLSGEMRIGLVWGDGIMDMAIDGAWIGEQPYDGSLPDGVLDLFRLSAYNEKIRNLKIWDAADKSLIS